MPRSEIEVIAFVEGAEHARYPAGPGSYTLGRASDCEIRIEADLVSPQHARLTIGEDGALVIEDLANSSGTFLDDEKVAGPTSFSPHQCVRIGAATLLIQQGTADVSLSQAYASGCDSLPPELTQPDRYEIGAEIAKGGMGAVLAALQPAIRRQVAMKVMLRQTSPRDRMRFIEEAQVTGQLEHPNIVPVHELGLDARGQPFYTMKLVKGITLKKILDLLKEGHSETVAKYPLPALLTIFQKICDALAFAHSKGVIHRDLKPANIMVGRFGEVLVMDWGLAKVIGADSTNQSAESLEISLVGSARQEQSEVFSTLDGAVMGTPQYMSPEQARGEAATLDRRSDIYALGAILHHLLALRPPVSGRTAGEVVAKVARGEIEPLPKGHVPDSLTAVVRKAMSFDPTTRYASVADLQADVLAYQNGFATSAEHAGAWKQLTLLVKRNKALFSSTAAATVIIAAVVGIAFKRVAGERNIAVSQRNVAEKERHRAEDALSNLAKTAPTFAAIAKGLVEQGNLGGALEKIGYAVSLDPHNADFLLQRANLLQATQKLADAAEGYRGVLALRADPAAKMNLELCEKLLRDNAGGTELKRVSQESLLNAMIKQGRAVEAAPLSRILGQDSDTALAAIKARLKPILGVCGPSPFTGDHRLQTLLPDGSFMLGLYQKPIAELPSLTGLAISEIDLSQTKVSDLTPLKGLRLRRLNIVYTPVSDLSPLAGMSLESLQTQFCREISDLTPLKGMPIAELSVNSTSVSDLSALRGMPLKKLDIDTTSVIDLRPLAGMALENLRIYKTAVRDVSPLAGMPLTFLEAYDTKIVDLSPLRGMPLQFLSLTRTPVSDLSPLEGMPIEELRISGTKVTDISVLRTLPLKRLTMQCPVKDLSPLADCKGLERLEIPKVTTDISFLRVLPNLKRLTDEADMMGNINMSNTPAAEEFWKKYDAQQAAGKK